MPTASKGYEVNGKKVPSVTTVIGVGLGGYSKDALMAWAAKEAREGRDYRQTRDTAANVGTTAHLLIEAFLNDTDANLDGIPDDVIANAQPALTAFMEWYGQNDVVTLMQERQFTSKKYNFGGCLDAVIRLNGVLTLADWKSSKDIYGSMVAQIGAYYQLIRENLPRPKWPQQAVIVRAGKDGVMRSVELDVADLNFGWEVFQAALAVYNARYRLDAMVKAEPIQRVIPEGKVTLRRVA